MADSTCPTCKGVGAFSYECNRCTGTGKFRDPQTNEVRGNCRQCGGSGRFYPQWKASTDHPVKTFNLPFISLTLATGTEILAHRCRVCRGSGKVQVESSGDSYAT